MHLVRLVCIALLAPRLATAQSLRVDSSTLVMTAAPDHPIVEPYLAIDPLRPNHLLAAAILDRTPGLRYPAGLDEQKCGVFVSLDSGMTWTHRTFDVSWCFDPWVAMTPDGQALVTMIGQHRALPQQGSSGLLAFHSSDGGVTWDSLPLGLGRSHDHPTMAVDYSDGPRRGWIYLASHRGRSADDGHFRYGLFLARSRTGGTAFDDPVWLLPNNLHNLSEMPVVLSDGTLVGSFVDAAYSPDSGDATKREVLFERRRAWVVRSSDGGFTFSPPLFVTDACGPPPGYRLSALAADVSKGRNDGRLYFACWAAGGGPIVVTHSRDRGETWSPAVRMRATSHDSTSYAIPGIAVNDHGEVLAAWIGPSAGGAPPCETSLFAAVSTDGGESFSPPVVVATCAGGGDYFGIGGVGGHRFRLLWPETRSGVNQLRTTELRVVP